MVPKRIKPVVQVSNPEPAEEPIVEIARKEPESSDDGIIRRIVPFGKSRDKARETEKVSDPSMDEPITRILDVDAFQDNPEDMRIPEIEADSEAEPVTTPDTANVTEPEREHATTSTVEIEPVPDVEPETAISAVDRDNLETALSKLKSLKSRWEKYQT